VEDVKIAVLIVTFRLFTYRALTVFCFSGNVMLREILNRILPQRQRAQFKTFLPLRRIGNHREYADYMNKIVSEYRLRRDVERNLILDHNSFVVPGWCFVCRKEVTFHVDFSYSYFVDGELMPNWREHLSCPGCGLNNRMRAAIHVFEQECVPHQSSRIYITEQTTPLFQAMLARYPSVIGSEYLAGTSPFGALDAHGIRNESITKLTFPNDAFDYILSFDVFEHVPDYTKAFAECFRCLKPDGNLLFTVPFTGNPDTLVRAQVNADGTISHLMPPEYHGDPLNTNGCLCFYHFGWDMLENVRKLGFRDAVALIYWSRDFGYLGNSAQVIFTAQKRGQT